MFGDYYDSPPSEVTEELIATELAEAKPVLSAQTDGKKIFVLYFAFDKDNNLKQPEEFIAINRVVQTSNYHNVVEIISNSDKRYLAPDYCAKGRGSFLQLIKIIEDVIHDEEKGIFWLLHLSCRGNMTTVEFYDGPKAYNDLVLEILASLKKSKLIKKIPGIFLSVCSSDNGANKLREVCDFPIGATRNIDPDFAIDCTKTFYERLMSGKMNFAQSINVVNSDFGRGLLKKEDPVVSGGLTALPFACTPEDIDQTAPLYYLSRVLVSDNVKQLELRVHLKRYFERLEYDKIYRNAKNSQPLQVDACNISFGKEKTFGGAGTYGVKKISWRKKSPHRVLITGCVKSGKTSLCKRIVYDWENKGVWKADFNLLLWFPLSYLKRISVAKRTSKITDFLYEFFFHNHSRGEELARQLHERIDENPHKVLFVIDDFDEVADLKDDVNIQGFLDFLLKHPKILAVSKPENETLSAISFQDRFEIFGFKQKDINRYLDRVFEEDDEIKSKIKKFIKKRLKRDKVIREDVIWNEILRIPGYLDIICDEWNSLTDKNVSWFVLEFNLYRACIKMLWGGVSRQVEVIAEVKSENESFLKQMTFAYLREHKLDVSKFPKDSLENMARCGFDRYLFLLMLVEVYAAEYIAGLLEENKNAEASSFLLSRKNEQKNCLWARVAICLNQKKVHFSKLYNLIPPDFGVIPDVPARAYGPIETDDSQDGYFYQRFFSGSSFSDSDNSLATKNVGNAIDVTNLSLRLQCLEVSKCRFIDSAAKLAIYDQLRSLVDFLYSGGAVVREGQRRSVTRCEGLTHLIKNCPYIVEDSKLFEYVLSKEKDSGVTSIGFGLLKSFSGFSTSIVHFIKRIIIKSSFSNNAAQYIRPVKLLLSCDPTAIDQEVIKRLVSLLPVKNDALKYAVIKVLKKFHRIVDNDEIVEKLLVLLRSTKLAVEFPQVETQALDFEIEQSEQEDISFQAREEDRRDSDVAEFSHRAVYPFVQEAFTLRAVVDVLKHLQKTMSKEKRLYELMHIMQSTTHGYVRARLLYLLKFLSKKVNSDRLLNFLCSQIEYIPIKSNGKFNVEFKNLLALYEKLLPYAFSKEQDSFLLLLMKKMKTEEFSCPGLVEVTRLLPLSGVLVTKRGLSLRTSTVSASRDSSNFNWEDLNFFLEHSNKYIRMSGLHFVQKASIENSEIFHNYIESFSHPDYEVQLTFVETFLEFVTKEKQVLMMLCMLTEKAMRRSIERISKVIRQLAEAKLVLTEQQVLSAFARMFECRWVHAAVVYSFTKLLQKCDNEKIIALLFDIVNEEIIIDASVKIEDPSEKSSIDISTRDARAKSFGEELDIPTSDSAARRSEKEEVTSSDQGDDDSLTISESSPEVAIPIDGVIAIYRIMKTSIDHKVLDNFITGISAFKNERLTADLARVLKTFNVSLIESQIVSLMKIIKILPETYDASIKADLMAAILPSIVNVSELMPGWIQFLYDTLNNKDEENIVRQSAARSIKFILGDFGYSALGQAAVKNIFHCFVDIVNNSSESLRLKIISIKALKNFSDGEYKLSAISCLSKALSGRYTFVNRNIIRTLLKLILSDKSVKCSEDITNQILIMCSRAQIPDFKSRYYLIKLLSALDPFPQSNTSLLVLLKLLFRSFRKISDENNCVEQDVGDFEIVMFNDSYPDLASFELVKIAGMTLDLIFTQFKESWNGRVDPSGRSLFVAVSPAKEKENEKTLKAACCANEKNPYHNVDVLIAILELATVEYCGHEKTETLALDENLQALRDSRGVKWGYSYKALFLVGGAAALAGLAWYAFFRQSSDSGDSTNQLSNAAVLKK